MSALECSWPDLYFKMARVSCALCSAQGHIGRKFVGMPRPLGRSWSERPEVDVCSGVLVAGCVFQNGQGQLCALQCPGTRVRAAVARARCSLGSGQSRVCGRQWLPPDVHSTAASAGCALYNGKGRVCDLQPTVLIVFSTVCELGVFVGRARAGGAPQA